MDPAVLKQMLVMLIPILGKVLKSIPLINNRLIPAILGIFLTVKNYWIMADLPMELVPEVIGWMPGDSEYALASPLSFIGKNLLAVAWGFGESYIASRFHRSFKYRDRAKAMERGDTMAEAKKADRWWI